MAMYFSSSSEKKKRSPTKSEKGLIHPFFYPSQKTHNHFLKRQDFKVLREIPILPRFFSGLHFCSLISVFSPFDLPVQDFVHLCGQKKIQFFWCVFLIFLFSISPFWSIPKIKQVITVLARYCTKRFPGNHFFLSLCLSLNHSTQKEREKSKQVKKKKKKR